DKGFGPALGPMAAAIATERFKGVGYTVTHGSSDWTFTPKDADIQTEIVTGWAAAAREIGALEVDDIIKWLARRRDHIAAGRSAMRVGHIDFFARLTTTRGAGKSKPNSPPSPSRCVRMGARIASSARAIGLSVKPAGPAPMMIGATTTCSRSRQPVARK